VIYSFVKLIVHFLVIIKNNERCTVRILKYQSFCQSYYIMDYAIRRISKITSDRTLYGTALRDNDCYKTYFFILFLYPILAVHR
jgi:hypothetical protein